MNEVIKQIYERKSIRKYLAKPIAPDLQKQIFDACLQAPTAGNMTLYSIIHVTDVALKKKLSVSCDNQPFIADAPMVMIFCADYRRWYDSFCLYDDAVRKPAAGDLFLAMQDTLIAAQNAVVAAESLGIGSCYIGDILENYEYHKELLGLPKYVVPITMLCLGYPTQQQKDRPKPVRFSNQYIVHENSYTPSTESDLKDMLKRNESLSDEQLPEWVQAFCKRKWNSAFSEEMSRSVDALLAGWNA